MEASQLLSCLLIAFLTITGAAYAGLPEYEEGQETIDGVCYDFLILRDNDKNYMTKHQKLCGESLTCWELVYEGPIQSYTPTHSPSHFYPVQFDGNGNGILAVAPGRGGYLGHSSSGVCYPWAPNSGSTIVVTSAYFMVFQ